MNTDTTDVTSVKKPQGRKIKLDLRPKRAKHKGQIIKINLDLIEKIAMGCVTWEEARSHVDLLEKIFGINAPRQVVIVINRIKERFRAETNIYKAKKVVLNNNHFEAVNKVTGNKEVNF